jgi:hypothetical protein
MVSLLSACCAYYFCSHKKSCLATYSLRIFLIDVSNRFKKIKEHVNLPKYPLAAEFLTPWHRPSRCLLTPWCRPSCLLPKPRHRRSWRRRPSHWAASAISIHYSITGIHLPDHLQLTSSQQVHSLPSHACLWWSTCEFLAGLRI